MPSCLLKGWTLSGCPVSFSSKEKCSSWYPGIARLSLQHMHHSPLHLQQIREMFLLSRVFCSAQHWRMLSHFPQQAEMEAASSTKSFLSQPWLGLAFGKFSSERADFSEILHKLRSSTVYTGHKGNLELGFLVVPSALQLIFPACSPDSFL